MALAKNPGFGPAALGLVRVLNDAGHFSHAEKEARALLARQPAHAEAHCALGIALRGRDRLAEAESSYRRALELKPGYAVAHHNLGALLAQQQRAEQALEELDRAAGLGLRGRELAFNRGRVLADLGRFDEAERAYLESLAGDPAYLDGQAALAKLRYMRGDAAFDREIAKAAAARPDDPRLALAHSDLLRLAGRLQESETVLQRLLARRGGLPQATAALAIVLHEQGRLDEALAAARAARQAGVDDASVDESLVGIMLSLGQASGILPIVRRRRELAPLDQRWIAYEATALRLLGDPLYGQLYDYERFVRPYTLEPPAGWRDIESFNADLAVVLTERHRFQAHPLDQSLRLGTQTPRSLLADPDPTLRAFLQALAAPIAAYREAIGRDASHPLLSRNAGEPRFVGCWSVRLRRGGYHVNHTHPAGWISSAYYVEVPPEVADEEAHSGWIKFGEPGLPVAGALPERFVQPRPGRLVLFPSYLWHGTTPITGDDPRMTIAFDVVPGDAGHAR
jgi:Flp pilus assembly protein TadD